MRKLILLGISFVLCLSLSAQADMVYQGSLSLSGGGLFGVGFGSGDDATMAWEVSRNPLDPYDPWHYKYTLSFDPPVSNSISHVAIEVSDNFDSLFNLQVSPPSFYTATPPVPGYEPTSQPWVPGTMYAIKFDSDVASNVVDSLTIEFDSWRVPDWGDFNAKGGNVSTSAGGWYLYNSGFTASEENDPAFNPAALTYLGFDGTDYRWTGSVANHIIVPDTTVVPIPAAVLLGILGLGVAGIKLRKLA